MEFFFLRIAFTRIDSIRGRECIYLWIRLSWFRIQFEGSEYRLSVVAT